MCCLWSTPDCLENMYILYITEADSIIGETLSSNKKEKMFKSPNVVYSDSMNLRFGNGEKLFLAERRAIVEFHYSDYYHRSGAV